MKQSFRRVTGMCLLILFLLSSITSANMFAAMADKQGLLFADDFSSAALKANGWSYDNNHIDGSNINYGYVEEGALRLGLRNHVSASGNWTDYSVEADVRLSSETNRDGAGVGIAARGDITFSRGFEFFLLQQGDAARLRLFTRGGKYASNPNSFTTDAIYELDRFYNLKLQVYGTRIKCYIEDTLVFDILDDTPALAGGYAGVKSVNGIGYIDNFKVLELGEKNILDLRVEENLELPINMPPEFNIQVIYSGNHASDLISSQAPGVTVSGFVPSKSGAQEISVSYAGFSKNITVSVSSLMFSDDFSSAALKSNGWMYDNNYVDGSNINYGSVEEGALRLGLRNLIGVSQNWTDYSVEADVRLSSETNRDGAGVGIAARGDNTFSRGFEFFLLQQGGAARLRLFTRGGKYASNPNSFTTDAIYELDRYYHLKLQVYGTRIKCYIEDTLVFDILDDTPALTDGYAGVKSVNGIGHIDHFKVFALGEKNIIDLQVEGTPEVAINKAPVFDIKVIYSGYHGSEVVNSSSQNVTVSNFNPSKEGNQEVSVSYSGFTKNIVLHVSNVLFADDFSSAALKTNGWSYDNNHIDGSNINYGYVDGGALRLGLRNLVNASESWTNYSVEADVLLSSETNRDGAGVGIGAMADKTMSRGFELCLLQSGNAAKLRLFTRGGKYASSPDSFLTDPVYQLNKYYRLKLQVFSGRIKGYIDDVLIFDMNDNTVALASGYTGVKSINGIGYIDNFRVIALGDKNITGISAQDIPGSVPLGTDWKDLKFKIKVTYSGAHGYELISPTAPGISISGYNAQKKGDQTVTVAYQGFTTSFPVLVVDAPVVLFEDNFTSGLNKWILTKTENKDNGFVYQFIHENGTAIAKFPDKIGSFEGPLFATASLPGDVVSKWPNKNWAIQADAKIISDSITGLTNAKPVTRAGTALLQIASDKETKEDYTFRLTSQSKAQLFKGSTLIQEIDLLEFLGIEIKKDAFYALKAEVYGDALLCFVNNKEVISYLDFDADSIVPKPGIRAYNGTVVFDNFKAFVLAGRNEGDITSISVEDASKQIITQLRVPALDLSSIFLRAYYKDGSSRPFKISSNMISGYDKNKISWQKITVSFAGKTATFDLLLADILFWDDFSNGYRKDWEFVGDRNYLEWFTRNGVFVLNRIKTFQAAVSFMATVKGSSNWEDYSVSADVMVDQLQSPRVKTAGVTARRTASNYYEFRIQYEQGALSAVFYRFDKTGAHVIYTFNANALKSIIGDEKSLGAGVSYNVELECRGNTISGYFEGNRMFEFIDGEPHLKGMAGFKMMTTGGAVDNFTVIPLKKREIQSLTVLGLTKGVLTVYPGHDIDTGKISLQINYSDGKNAEVPITPDMLSGFDNTKLGKQTVTVSYLGKKTSFIVNVIQRTEEINAVVKQINALDLNSLTRADKERIYNLKAKYDSFSYLEVKDLSESVKKKLFDAITHIHKLLYPALKNSNPDFYDDFLQGSGYTWRHDIEYNFGKWIVKNGQYYMLQRNFNISNIAMATTEQSFERIDSVSADVTLSTANTFAGIVSGVNIKGYYQARLTNKTRDSKNNVTYSVQLYKKTVDGQAMLASELPILHGIEVKENIGYSLRMVTVDNKVTVYLNDELMIEYAESDPSTYFASGRIALRASEGDAVYDNVTVWGKQAKVSPATNQPTVYNDDFEDESAGGSPSHWIDQSSHESDTDYWKVFRIGGNNVYGTQYRGGYTQTWLHGFEKDPEFSSKLMVTGKGANAKIGLITRMTVDTAFVKAGYDFAKSKWYIESSQGSDFETQIFYAKNTSTFALNTWHEVRVVAEGHSMSVFVNNGKTAVVSAVNSLDNDGFGRCGLFSDNAALYADNVVLKMPNGGAVTDGVTEYKVLPDVLANFMEIEEVNGSLIAITKSAQLISTNMGKTWAKVNDLYKDLKVNESAGNLYSSVIKLKSGVYLQVNNLGLDILSSGDMKSWKKIGHLVPPAEATDTMGRVLPIYHVNSLTEVVKKDGGTRIFLPVAFRRYQNYTLMGHYTKIYYSDDGGATWKSSDNDTRDLLPNFDEKRFSTWAESKVIKCADGTLRMYYSRNSFGQMCYTVSKDDGVTWEGFYTIPYIQCSMSSFAIYQDPFQAGTYYMAWVNNQPEFLGSITPRIRLSLAKSTDGANWEFIMDIDRVLSVGAELRTASVYQILDPSLFVTKDNIYISYGRSESAAPLGNASLPHGEQRIRYVKLVKSILTTKPWDSTSISDTTFPKSVEISKMPKTKYGKGDIFSLLGGEFKVTKLDGSIAQVSMEGYKPLKEPNMFKLGKQTITILYDYGILVDFDILIVPYYSLKWDISGSGKVAPDLNKIMEGETQEFKLIPASGYKTDYVFIDGEAVEIKKGCFTLENVQNDLNINIVFAKLSILDYWPWFAGIFVIISAALVIVIVLRKRKGGHLPPADHEQYKEEPGEEEAASEIFGREKTYF